MESQPFNCDSSYPRGRAEMFIPLSHGNSYMYSHSTTFETVRIQPHLGCVLTSLVESGWTKPWLGSFGSVWTQFETSCVNQCTGLWSSWKGWSQAVCKWTLKRFITGVNPICTIHFCNMHSSILKSFIHSQTKCVVLPEHTVTALCHIFLQVKKIQLLKRVETHAQFTVWRSNPY